MNETTVDQLRVVVVFEDGNVQDDLWTLTADKDCLAHLQEVVGGLVDCVGLTPTADLWVNDEGLYLCGPNPVATVLAHVLANRDLAQPLFGPAVFTGGVDEEGTTLGLTADAAQVLTAQAAWIKDAEADTLTEIALIGQRITAQVR
jgi:hypothetical protein